MNRWYKSVWSNPMSRIQSNQIFTYFFDCSGDWSRKQREKEENIQNQEMNIRENEVEQTKKKA